MILIRQGYNNSHVTIIEIFQKKTKRKKEYKRDRYKILSEEKKQKRKEYLRSYYKARKNNKLNDLLDYLD